MVDPFVVGPFLGWAAGRVADRLFDRLLDRVFDGPRTWRTPWDDGPDTLEITVGNHLRIQARTPVILTLQQAGDTSGGSVVSLMLGDTTRVSLPRGNYVGSAMIMDPARESGARPLLRGFGWSPVRIADRGPAQLVIPTHVPSVRQLSDVGLNQPDGTPLFRLPPTRRWTPPVERQIRTRSGLFIPDPGPAPRTRNPFACSALDSMDKQCSNSPAPGGKLCPQHLRQQRQGLIVYDFQSRRPIR